MNEQLPKETSQFIKWMEEAEIEIKPPRPDLDRYSHRWTIKYTGHSGGRGIITELSLFKALERTRLVRESFS